MTTEIAFELKDDEAMIEMLAIGDNVYAASNKRVYMLEWVGDRATMQPVPFLYDEEA